jgi:hypothetical protein
MVPMKPREPPTNAEMLKGFKVLQRDVKQTYKYERFVNYLGKNDSKNGSKELFQFLILIFIYLFLILCMNFKNHYDSFIFVQ